jgi:cysteine-rich repeat protein
MICSAMALVLASAGCSGCHGTGTAGDGLDDDVSLPDDGHEALDDPGVPDGQEEGPPDTLDPPPEEVETPPHDGTDEPFPDPGDPDPWVPDTWEVPFDYMDIPSDYVPDPAGCGNGVVDPGEECDDGNGIDGDECTNRCLFPRCGDGSVWYGMEECDPTGSVRPCMTSCGTTGGEWCDIYCNWSGDCVPPRETCGNGVDDDCDGEVDAIVRLVSDVRVSSDAIFSGMPSSIVWTGSEFAASWLDYLRNAVLTRMDVWGRRTGWDTVIVVDPHEMHGLDWTGSLLTFFWTTDSTTIDLHFQALDATGLPVTGPLTIESGGNCCERLKKTRSETGFGLVHRNHFEQTAEREPHYSFVHVSSDGSDVSGEITLGDYLRVHPRCVVWTGSEYGVLLLSEDVSGDLDEKRIDYVTSEGVVTHSVVAELEPFEDELACAWTGSGLASVTNQDAGGMTMSILLPDGSLAHAEEISPLDAGTAKLVWTGSELGLFWNDDRSGNNEIYFARVSADGSKIGRDVRLTRSPFDSGLPSAAWTGSSYGVTWSDADGVDNVVFFTHFSPCPP